MHGSVCLLLNLICSYFIAFSLHAWIKWSSLFSHRTVLCDKYLLCFHYTKTKVQVQQTSSLETPSNTKKCQLTALIYIYIYGSGLGYTWNNSLLQGSSHYLMASDWINILKIPLLDYTIFLFSTCMPKICDFWMLFYYLIPKLMFCIYLSTKNLKLNLFFF